MEIFLFQLLGAKRSTSQIGSKMFLAHVGFIRENCSTSDTNSRYNGRGEQRRGGEEQRTISYKVVHQFGGYLKVACLFLGPTLSRYYNANVCTFFLILKLFERIFKHI